MDSPIDISQIWVNLWQTLSRFEQLSNYFVDVNALVKKLLDAERANQKIQEKILGNYYHVSLQL